MKRTGGQAPGPQVKCRASSEKEREFHPGEASRRRRRPGWGVGLGGALTGKEGRPEALHVSWGRVGCGRLQLPSTAGPLPWPGGPRVPALSKGTLSPALCFMLGSRQETPPLQAGPSWGPWDQEVRTYVCMVCICARVCAGTYLAIPGASPAAPWIQGWEAAPGRSPSGAGRASASRTGCFSCRREKLNPSPTARRRPPGG